MNQSVGFGNEGLGVGDLESAPDLRSLFHEEEHKSPADAPCPAMPSPVDSPSPALEPSLVRIGAKATGGANALNDKSFKAASSTSFSA